MSFQPKTYLQIKCIFALCNRQGIDADGRFEAVNHVTKGRTGSLKELSFTEANQVIEHLGGRPVGFQRRPRRTVNHHRKEAGIQQIAQPGHLDKMYDLASGRNMSDAGLQGMGQRMLKHWPPRTTAETNKIIEALKAMNDRDNARRVAA